MQGFNFISFAEWFVDPNNQLVDDLQTVLRRLQSDKDIDVRQAALLEPFTVIPIQ